MRLRFKALHFAASAAILFGTSTSIAAAKRPAPPVRAVGLAELEMQVLWIGLTSHRDRSTTKMERTAVRR